MRDFFIRCFITLGVFTCSAGMVWLMLEPVRDLSSEGEMTRPPEPEPQPQRENPEPASAPPPAVSANSSSSAPPAPDPSPPTLAPPRNVLAELNDAMASVVERTLPGVVRISVERTRTVKQPMLLPNTEPRIQARPIREESVGSGTLVSAAGDVITNWHVVAGESVKIQVMLHNEDSWRPASVIDHDEALDIALLRIESKIPGEAFAFLSFGDSDLSQQAHMVLAVGSPLNLAETVTLGIISNRARRVSDIQTSFFQTDCIINPGNSGGPLVNLSGEIIGINTRMVEPPEQPSGQIFGQSYGLAIPSNEVQDAYDRMVHKGRDRGYLGVSVDDWPASSYQRNRQPESAVVLGVERGSPAAAVGLRKDDVIKSLDGLPVRSAAEFFRRLRKKQVGEQLVIGMVRNRQEQYLTVQVANLNTIFAAQPVPESHVVAGLKVRDLRKGEHVRYRLAKPFGVLIEEVAPESPLRGLVTPNDLILSLDDGLRQTQTDNVKTFLARTKELEGTTGPHYLNVVRASGQLERVMFSGK